jgi:hypothetical protein
MRSRVGVLADAAKPPVPDPFVEDGLARTQGQPPNENRFLYGSQNSSSLELAKNRLSKVSTRNVSSLSGYLE